MVHDLLFPELLLGMLLWLGVHAYLQWRRGSATKLPPAQRTTRLPQTPKPFAGLTQKPHCEACEQSRAHLDQSPLSPPPVIASKRGRPRAVGTHTQYCPQKTCAYYGWVGRGNVRANGHPSSGGWRQFHCVVCNTYFLETHCTPLYGKPRPAERTVQAVAAMAEGLGIRAVARVFEVDPNTVLAWLSEAAAHSQAFSRYRLHDLEVGQIQLDELFAWLSNAKADRGSDVEDLEHCQRFPYWVWAAIDPVNKLLLALDVGERTLAMAQQLIHQVVQMLAPSCVPLFLTDGFKAYGLALLTHFGQWMMLPRQRPNGPAPLCYDEQR